MKKIIALAVSAALVSSSAFAELNPQPYVGLEGSINNFGLSKETNKINTTAGRADRELKISKKTKPGVGAFVGVQLNDYVAVEAGAAYVTAIKVQEKIDNENKDNGKIGAATNYRVDVIGSYPVSKEFSVLGSVGVGVLNAKMKDTDGKEFTNAARAANGNLNPGGEKVFTKKSQAGVRLGAGVQYKFTENVSTRLMGVWQKAGGKNNPIKDMKSANLSLIYSFK